MGGLTWRLSWLEWSRNERKWQEWCPQVIQRDARSQSRHHPLQRLMGGLTRRLEWLKWAQSWMLLKWQNDGRMSGISKFNFFADFQNHTHSSSFRHSLSFSNAQEWKLREEGCHSYDIQFIFTSFPSDLSFKNVLEWWNEGGMSDIFEARQNP